MKEKTEYRIRTARPEDLDQIAAVEEACFPAAEAAGREQIRERLAAYRDSFLVAQLSKSDRIIGFINGAVTDDRGAPGSDLNGDPAGSDLFAGSSQMERSGREKG